MSTPSFNPDYRPHRCERCGRTDQGPNRCPHAMDPKWSCPHDPRHKDLTKRMRKLGR